MARFPNLESNCCEGPRGRRGQTGAQGPVGPQGPAGEGVPPGGDPGQVLAKITNTDYDTEWITSPASSATWGFITGTLSDQTDLQAALDAKQATITLGLTSQYFRGDLSLALFPTLLSDFTNDVGFITGVAWGQITGTLSDQTDLQSALNLKQNVIALGSTAQYFRGDLSLATFPTLLSQFTNDTGFITNANGLFVNNVTNTTLTRTGAGPYTLGLNLSEANVWLSDQSVPDEVFGPSWNGSVEVPTKNAVYDAVSAIVSGVSSVTAANSTLTISPTTGAVIAGLNLSTANTWLAAQSVPDEVFGVGWNGSVQVPTKNAVYDAITGGYVPYTGATANVDLGNHNLKLVGTLDIGDITTDALIIGDISGDARGSGAIDIQQARSATTQVAAGINSTAFGKNNTASSRNSVAIGNNNSVSTTVTNFDTTLQRGTVIGSLNSTVTTEALTSDTSVTIVINGTTYKLLAKA